MSSKWFLMFWSALVLGSTAAKAGAVFKLPFKTTMIEKANLADRPEKCPESGRCGWLQKSYLVPEDPILVDKIENGFAHVTYRNNKRKIFTGWVPESACGSPPVPRKDPSLDVEYLEPQDCVEEKGSAVHHRFRADLNGDGREDLLLSSGCRQGNGSGLYEVFLYQQNELYLSIGEVDGHPLAVTFRRENGKGILSSHAHNSVRDGSLNRYSIENGEVRSLESKMIDSEDFDKELTKGGAKFLRSETGHVKGGKVKWEATVLDNPEDSKEQRSSGKPSKR